MLALLEIVHGPDKGRKYSFGRQQKMTIGRGMKSSICLTDAQVSRAHCEVEFQGERVLVTDAGSGTGTWVNGQQIHAPQEISAGDVILVGQTQLAFHWSDADQHPTQAIVEI